MGHAVKGHTKRFSDQAFRHSGAKSQDKRVNMVRTIATTLAIHVPTITGATINKITSLVQFVPQTERRQECLGEGGDFIT